MILAVVASAFWIMWQPHDVQIGVAAGPRSNPHLILLVPPEGCAAGMKIYSGQYGDLEAATNLLAESKVCQMVERRAAATRAASATVP